MNGPMIVWMVVVAVLLTAFVWRVIEQCRKCSKGGRSGRKVFEVGEEGEMFYCPGDKTKWDDVAD